MAPRHTIHRGPVRFELYRKSIRVSGIAETLFLGHQPTEKDVDFLCDVLAVGARLQSARMRRAMSGELFGEDDTVNSLV